MANTLLWFIFLGFIGLLGYTWLIPKQAGNQITVTPQKPILRDVMVGGESAIEKVKLQTKDVATLQCANGMGFQVNKDELQPLDVFQCISNQAPVWVLNKENGLGRKGSGLDGKSSDTREKERATRERDFERARAIRLESNFERESEKAIEKAVRLVRSSRPEDKVIRT